MRVVYADDYLTLCADAFHRCLYCVFFMYDLLAVCPHTEGPAQH